MAHRLIARCSKQNLKAREIQEQLMTRRARKQPMTLEVHVMFEPNREADCLLHKAYASLLPVARRRRLASTRTEAISPETQNWVGERKLP